MANYRPGTGDAVAVHWLFAGHCCSGVGVVTSVSEHHVTVCLTEPAPGPAAHPIKGPGHRDWRVGDYIVVSQAGGCWHPHVRVEPKEDA